MNDTKVQDVADLLSAVVNDREYKPPAEYGRILKACREAAGISVTKFVELSGKDQATIWRNENGHERRSLKAMTAMRNALVKAGCDVPPIPLPNQPAHGDVAPKLSPMADRIRWNLIRFREALDLDRAGAAYVTKIPLRTWILFEDGDEEPSGSQLVAIAQAFGCKLGDFDLEVDAAAPSLRLSTENETMARYHKVVSAATPDEIAEIDRILDSVRARVAPKRKPK